MKLTHSSQRILLPGNQSFLLTKHYSLVWSTSKASGVAWQLTATSGFRILRHVLGGVLPLRRNSGLPDLVVVYVEGARACVGGALPLSCSRLAG